MMWKITEQEAFITSVLYKTQSYRINRNSMGRTSIMRGDMINVHKILVCILKGNELYAKCYILLTVHLVMILGKWPNWRTILFYVFISILYMFRATSCSSSEESIASIQHLVYVTLCRCRCSSERNFPTCTRNGHRHRVTYTRCCIDTVM
jgi:hypothetical protein